IYPSATDHNFSFNGICENSSDIDSATINYEFYLDSSNPPTTLRKKSFVAPEITGVTVSTV
ncbi:unnamed protein product, partial [marine sediment metagenome]